MPLQHRWAQGIKPLSRKSVPRKTTSKGVSKEGAGASDFDVKPGGLCWVPAQRVSCPPPTLSETLSEVTSRERSRGEGGIWVIFIWLEKLCSLQVRKNPLISQWENKYFKF